jgi:hypothetical protein
MRNSRRPWRDGLSAKVISPRMSSNYLLNPAHRYGASKARFFAQFGFSPEAWEVLAAALRGHGQQHEISKVKQTGFGPR